MEGNREIFTVIIPMLLLITQASGTDELQICEDFKRNTQIHHIIENSRDNVPPCACAEQQISLDYSFKKDGRCYSQWFFENGVKQMCCYSEEGILQTSSPNGGYLLTDDFDMTLVKESCCKNVDMCHLFYTLDPSNNCSSIRPQETITSWGDPVIQTIDGATYDFNGHGEYVFLKTNKFEIQARTDYVTPGNIDSTLFSAFAFFDNSSGQQIELHHNRSSNDIIIYEKGDRKCNASKNQRDPCLLPIKNKCFVLAGGGIVLISKCGVEDFATKIDINIAGGYMRMKITKKSDIESMNITGLAGKLKNGTLVGRKGTHTSVNASDSEIFDISETWSLQNKEESRFYYNITGGDFKRYNENHTEPAFLDRLLGNLTALFKTFSREKIQLFNDTCRNYWNNEPNKQCLLDIAKHKNFSYGIAVMKEANRTRKEWEINHNNPPVFNNGTPSNISVAYMRDPYWSLDLKKYVDDELRDQLRFQVQNGFPNNEYTLEKGIFNWTIGKGLRKIEGILTFIAYDVLNSSATHTISIQYCGCEQPKDCNFGPPTGKSFERVPCECSQYYKGEFCEDPQDPCENGSIACYENCNYSLPKPPIARPSWPCKPCPEGRTDVFTNNRQQCNDINECLDEEVCQHGHCNNNNGSYTCTCYAGFELESGLNICKDKDECKDNSELCEVDQVCVNTEGNYTCNCKSGFQLKTDSGLCKKIPGKVYVSSISFEVVIEKSYKEENIDSPENRKEMQDKLGKRYKNVTGFISVEVIKLTITFGDQGSRKKRADVNPHLNVQFILILNNTSNTTTIEKALVKANQMSSATDPTSTIGGLKILPNEVVNVSRDICSVPGRVDCDTFSTNCINSNTEYGYECKCKKGFEPFKTTKTECKDIDDCDLFRRNSTINNRCVHGKCLNTQGSWNCTCPNDRYWQNVGNDSVTMFRCQGNFTYLGEISVLFDSKRDDREQVEQLILKTTHSFFANKTFKEKGYEGVHISSLFVSVSVVTREEKNLTTKSLDRSYSVTIKVRMGEAVETKRLQTIMINLCDKSNPLLDASSIVLFEKCRMFTDSENILCNFTSNGGCYEQTTTCEQRRGKTYCKCKSGYEKHSEGDKYCRDLNECNNKTFVCHGGHCHNQVGNWSCTCQNNSFTPVRINTHTINCTEQHVNACASYPTFECRGGEKICGGNNWKCRCEKGALEMPVSDTLTICQDECKNGSHTCSGHGTCRNIEHGHGYTCDCDAGYIVNSTDRFNVACIDIDECNDHKYICGGGKCTNFNGNWSCDCDDGFKKSSNEEKTEFLCEDNNECDREDACINGFCENTVGSWNCLCHEGHKLTSFNDTSKICSDIDECSSTNFTCEGGFCTNFDGNWSCSCNETGFRRNVVTSNLIKCDDIDECNDHKYICGGGKCTNFNGNWSCDCNDGFRKITNEENTEFLCEDNNECDRKDACINGFCENTDGSWNCLCHEGHKLKSINDTSKICSEEFHYVMSVQIVSTASIQGSEDDLKLYLKQQMKIVYEAAFRGNGVRIEIISITTKNERRRKRAIETLHVKFIVHIDEGKSSEELKTAWHDYIANCSKTCMKTNKKFTFDIILNDGIEVDNDTRGGLCVVKGYNRCDENSTSCLYNNGTITCECKKGFERKSDTSCTVPVDACNNNPCDNGGECVIVNEHDESKRDFICKCENGWIGRYCHIKQEKRNTIKDSDTDTIFIATGSTLCVLVIVLLAIVLVVCRWKRRKDKEAKHLSKMLKSTQELRSFGGGSFRDDLSSEHSFNFRTFPRRHDEKPGNFVETGGAPYSRNSMPNIMMGDAYLYNGENLRNNSFERGRPSSWDPKRNLGSDWRRLSLQQESKYPPPPPSPRPDYNNTNAMFYKGANNYQDYRQMGDFQTNYGNNIKF